MKDLEKRNADITRAIEDSAKRDENARRLMTIPGIGALAATALHAAAGHGQQFKKGRDMAAWLGLVPQQYSTGGKPWMLGISKSGNRYVRRLLIHGSRSCVTHLNRSRNRLGRWIDQLQSRMHVNKVTEALTAKIARIARVILTRPGALYERWTLLIFGGILGYQVTLVVATVITVSGDRLRLSSRGSQ